MAFGQQSGPPATHRQVQELLELLQAAGHDSFREARGPMGFTQRQGNGKFTRDEAEAYIEQLQAAAEGGEPAPTAPPAGSVAPRGDRPARPARPARGAAAGPSLRDVPSDRLAAELQRRGWVVMEP